MPAGGVPQRVFELVQRARTEDAAAMRARFGAEYVLVGSTAAAPGSGGDLADEDEEWAFKTSVGSREALAIGLGPDFLEHEAIPLRKRTTFFADTFLIGRAATNDVCIEHPSVSKLHARIRRDREGGLTVADAGSANGTRHQGKPLLAAQTVKVSSGDDLQFGERAFRLYSVEELHAVLLRFGRTPSGGWPRV